MAHGYVSDVDGDDTLMQSPTVTVRIDPTQLSAQEAVALMQQAGSDQQRDWVVGALLDGDTSVLKDAEDIEFHLPLGPVLTALTAIDVLDIPEDPDDVEVDDL